MANIDTINQNIQAAHKMHSKIRAAKADRADGRARNEASLNVIEAPEVMSEKFVTPDLDSIIVETPVVETPKEVTPVTNEPTHIAVDEKHRILALPTGVCYPQKLVGGQWRHYWLNKTLYVAFCTEAEARAYMIEK